MLDHPLVRHSLVLLSFLLYGFLGYEIQRHETVPLFASFFGLFLIYIFIIWRANTQHVWFWIVCAVLFRCLLIFSLPALSDDFYRFVWDGRVIAAGLNPFSEIPSFYMHGTPVPGLDATLFDLLNSQERYSSYPPVCQFIFWISAELSPSSIWGSVVVMRLILFIFELGTLWIIRSLLSHFRLAPESILLYALNPLVIVEITGNLHFEGIMIFFLLLAIRLLLKNAYWASIPAFALSVCTKLIPLIFLPLLLRYLGWRKTLIYWVTTGLITLAFFIPLLHTKFVLGFSTSLGYYFQKFEFNASIYYLVREVGELIFGFNIIQYAGPALACAAAIIIFYISFRKVSGDEQGVTLDIFQSMLWCMLVYFLSTTILHPWYIITLLAVSVYTTYKFPVIWTGLIFLTYAGYTSTGFNENLLLVAFEYLLLFTMIFYETLWKRKIPNS